MIDIHKHCISLCVLVLSSIKSSVDFKKQQPNFVFLNFEEIHKEGIIKKLQNVLHNLMARYG